MMRRLGVLVALFGLTAGSAFAQEVDARAALIASLKAMGGENLKTIEIAAAGSSSLIGQQVTLHGEFSMEGKVGPFVRVSGNPVYLIARGMFAWGQRYERMEGKVVSVTGTLRFFKAPPAPKPVSSIPVAWVSDHFYFERGNSTIQLDNQ